MSSHFKRHGIKSSELLKLNNIFRANDWPIDREPHSEAYEDIAEMLRFLDSEAKELIFQLLPSFIHCTSSQYIPRAARAASKIRNEGYDEIYTIPLAAPKDRRKAKSSSVLIYDLVHEIMPKVDGFEDFDFRKHADGYLDDMKFSSAKEERENALVILFDDFIGSGDTAVLAMNHYDDEIRKPCDTTFILSLVSHTKGVERILNEGYNLVTDKIIEYGISGSSAIANESKALAVMDQLQQMIGVSQQSKFWRGYQKCEALVKLKRTPNNTFPIFWYNGPNNWPCPFPR